MKMLVWKEIMEQRLIAGYTVLMVCVFCLVALGMNAWVPENSRDIASKINGFIYLTWVVASLTLIPAAFSSGRERGDDAMMHAIPVSSFVAWTIKLLTGTGIFAGIILCSSAICAMLGFKQFFLWNGFDHENISMMSMLGVIFLSSIPATALFRRALASVAASMIIAAAVTFLLIMIKFIWLWPEPLSAGFLVFIITATLVSSFVLYRWERVNLSCLNTRKLIVAVVLILISAVGLAVQYHLDFYRMPDLSESNFWTAVPGQKGFLIREDIAGPVFYLNLSEHRLDRLTRRFEIPVRNGVSNSGRYVLMINQRGFLGRIVFADYLRPVLGKSELGHELTAASYTVNEWLGLVENASLNPFVMSLDDETRYPLPVTSFDELAQWVMNSDEITLRVYDQSSGTNTLNYYDWQGRHLLSRPSPGKGIVMLGADRKTVIHSMVTQTEGVFKSMYRYLPPDSGDWIEASDRIWIPYYLSQSKGILQWESVADGNLGILSSHTAEGYGKILGVWDVSRNAIVRVSPKENQVLFSNMSGSSEPLLSVASLNSDQIFHAAPELSGYILDPKEGRFTPWTFFAEWSPDESLIAIAGSTIDARIFIWSILDGRIKWIDHAMPVGWLNPRELMVMKEGQLKIVSAESERTVHDIKELFNETCI